MAAQMSRLLTLQDQVTEYVDRGLSILPLVPRGKVPLNEVLPLVHGTPSWTPYKTTAASAGDVLSWFADYGSDMGGTGLNIGIVTGYPGPICLYAVDVDRPDIPSTLAACNTTTVHTGRPGGGWHFYFTGPSGFPKQNVTIDGTTCEFKGIGSYVVAPVSVHESGTAYTFVEERELSAIQDMPGVLMQQLEAHSKIDLPRQTGPECRGRACLEQIWSRPLQEGERELSLYGLYQGLMTARHSEDYARQWVERKNAMLAVPMTDRELRQQVLRGPEAKRPGHKYGVGCPWMRRNLPSIVCDECKYRDKEASRLVNGRELDRAFDDKNMSPSAFNIYFALVKAELNTGVKGLSLTETAKRTGLAKSTVQEAFKVLRAKGYL
jgi:hypothetical protein